MEEMSVQVRLPIRAYSVANLREHWAARAKRAKSQRGVAQWMMSEALGMDDHDPREGALRKIIVRLTRIAPRRLDSDNLASSMKAIRDGVADALGVDDGDSRLTWEYAQCAEGKEYAVLVELRAKYTRARSKL